MQEASLRTQDVSRPMEYFISTGNLVSKTGLGLLQSTGFTIVADKLNFMRYMSHFRCVHRGAFFAEMRTTSVRKLLPEAWGFLCPVHTPDGTPCGLLNHLSASAKVINVQSNTDQVPCLLTSLGMVPYSTPLRDYSRHYPVMLDGKMIGWISYEQAPGLRDKLRFLKVTQQQKARCDNH